MTDLLDEKNKELEDVIDALEISHKRIDSLTAQNKVLEAQIVALKEECQSLSDENKARWQTEVSLAKLLHKVAHIIAMDTILDRTHRERNQIERNLVKLIMQSYDAEVTDMEDIPF